MTYSPEEAEIILSDAKALVEAGADGLVFGALKPDKTIDVELCKAVQEVNIYCFKLTFSVFSILRNIVLFWFLLKDSVLCFFIFFFCEGGGRVAGLTVTLRNI